MLIFLQRGSLTVAEGNFDHPVNGQKVNERAARSAPGQGTGAARRGWMRGASEKQLLPGYVALTIQRVFKLGYDSQVRFLGLA